MLPETRHFRLPDSRILIAVFCASSLLIAGCSEKAVEETEAPIRPAKLIQITATSNEETKSFPAVVEPSGTSELTFQVGGVMAELAVVDGQEVALDEVIARLDQTSYENELNAAQTQYDNAQAEYSRARKLIKDNAISRSVFEQRRTQRDVAKTTLNTAKKAFDDTILRSPFAGRISAVQTEQFQSVQPLEPIATLQTTGAAEAVIQVPSTIIAKTGRIRPLDTQVILDAAPDVRLPAAFKSIATQANVDTQTFTVKFGFTPPDKLVVLPGMTGKVWTRIAYEKDETTEDQASIPLAAVLSDGDERYVWLVDTESMTVSRRNIVIGSSVGEILTAVDGLKVGDTVVGAGTSYLHEGMKIRAFESQ